MKRMIHVQCGQPAFMVDEARCVPGAIVHSSMATHLDGSAIEPLSFIACDSCGERIKDLSRDNIVFED